MSELNILEELGLSNTVLFPSNEGSTPAPGTDERALFLRLSRLLELNIRQGASVNASVVNKSLVNFKPASLVIPSPDSKDKRWYIKVYANDPNKRQNVLKRYYRIEGNTVSEKRRNAAFKIKKINEALATGASFQNFIETKPTRAWLLREGFEHYRNSKRHTRSFGRKLDSYIKPYLDFCDKFEYLDSSITVIDKKHALHFERYIKSQGYSNRTINNYIGYAKAVWNYFIQQDEVRDTPFKNITSLKNSIGKNLAFLKSQIEILKPIHAQYPDLDFLAKFMYYTLARTNEISLIQVKHFNLYHPRQLYIPKENSKNGYERHIVIPAQLYDLILERGILNYPPDYYVFSKSDEKTNKYKPIQPAAHPTNSIRLGAKYRETILNPAKIGMDYTLYSWKHTGIINAHRAGVSDADIMQQSGHRNYESFTKYMKSLGLFASGQFAAKIPKI